MRRNITNKGNEKELKRVRNILSKSRFTVGDAEKLSDKVKWGIIEKIVSKSKLTQNQANKISDKFNESLNKKYKKLLEEKK